MPRLCRDFEAAAGTSSVELWGPLFTWIPKDPTGVKDGNSLMTKRQQTGEFWGGLTLPGRAAVEEPAAHRPACSSPGPGVPPQTFLAAGLGFGRGDHYLMYLYPERVCYLGSGQNTQPVCRRACPGGVLEERRSEPGPETAQL